MRVAAARKYFCWGEIPGVRVLVLAGGVLIVGHWRTPVGTLNIHQTSNVPVGNKTL